MTKSRTSVNYPEPFVLEYVGVIGTNAKLRISNPRVTTVIDVEEQPNATLTSTITFDTIDSDGTPSLEGDVYDWNLFSIIGGVMAVQEVGKVLLNAPDNTLEDEASLVGLLRRIRSRLNGTQEAGIISVQDQTSNINITSMSETALFNLESKVVAKLAYYKVLRRSGGRMPTIKLGENNRV